MNTRQLIIVLITVVAVILLGVGALIFVIGRGEQGVAEQTVDGTVSLFPVGGDRTTPLLAVSSSTDSGDSEAEVLIVGTPGLKRLAAGPISGAAFLKLQGKETVVYMERGSGHIFVINPENDFPTRISNATLPRITEAYWGQAAVGLSLITRGQKEGVENSTHNLKLALATSTIERDSATLETGLVNPKLDRLAVSPDGKSIFYLERADTGALGYQTDFSFTKPRKIFDHPLRQWEVSWPSTKLVSIQSRPAAGLSGVLFGLDPSTGALSTLLSNVPGLSAKVQPAGNHIVYSESGTSGLVTKLLDRKTKETTSLKLKTLADKCVWATKESTIYCGVPSSLPPSGLPDRWYRGEVGFSDNLTVINPTTKEETSVLNLATNNPDYPIDMINLTLNAAENYLLFTNKHDGSLWVLDLASLN